jgi:MoaA/NifB/PqqE/SkfB family radical SAM enzyme
VKNGLFNLARCYDALSSLYTLAPYRLRPGFAFPPLHLFVELTYRCNLRCRMCQFLPLLEKGGLEGRRGEELTAAEVVGFVQSFPRTAVVTFTGGEPLVRKDLPAIFAALAPRNKLHVITNGTLLDNPAASFLFEHRLRSVLGGGLFAVGVSLHGPGEVHDEIVSRKGAYALACAGIGRLRELREKARAAFPHVHVTCVITPANAGRLAETYRAARELGADYCNFTIMNSADFGSRIPAVEFPGHESSAGTRMRIDPGLLREQLRLITEESRGSAVKVRFSPFGITSEEVVRYYDDRSDPAAYRCYTPWRMLGISAYGDMSSCPFLSLGNIRAKRPRDVWNGPDQARFRKRLKERGIFPACAGCCAASYRPPRDEKG